MRTARLTIEGKNGIFYAYVSFDDVRFPVSTADGLRTFATQVEILPRAAQLAKSLIGCDGIGVIDWAGAKPFPGRYIVLILLAGGALAWQITQWLLEWLL